VFKDSKLRELCSGYAFRQVFLSLTVGLNVCVILLAQAAPPGGRQFFVTFADACRANSSRSCGDPPGRSSGKSASQTLDLALKPETYETVIRQGIRTQMKLQLNPGDHELRLGIMDYATGKSGTVGLSCQVPGSIPVAE
jgi:hypothetical protein